MITASALARNCAYAKVLSAKKPRTPDQQRAIDRGVSFHKAVEDWIKTGVPPCLDDLEMQGWIELLIASARIPRNAETEVAWGLTLDGQYTPVIEPQPHVYQAVNGAPLLTAGRADLVYERLGAVFVVDWKTGKYPAAPAPENLQVNAAGNALAQRAGRGRYVPAIYYVRDGVFDFGHVVELGTDAHRAMFAEIKAAALLPLIPRPGDHCEACWERKRCPEAA